MKRYEKMSKEEIINFMGQEVTCRDCKASSFCIGRKVCQVCFKEYLNQEIETKPRWATIKSNEDLDCMYEEWKTYPFNSFSYWLKEEVEE